jgi:hypothetical protein
MNRDNSSYLYTNYYKSDYGLRGEPCTLRLYNIQHFLPFLPNRLFGLEIIDWALCPKVVQQIAFAALPT